MDLLSTIRSTLGTRGGVWSFAWAWLLGFGLIAYLGLSGGGFDPLVTDQVGILIWWTVLLGTAVGALPRRRPGSFALLALGLLGGLALWTGLSLTWTESVEKTAADVALLATLLGAFALALLSRDQGAAERTAAAVGSAIALIALIGLLSRLHPDWFPAAAETGRFLDTGRERLSFPLDYWNSLAALIGVGLPLVAGIAATARSVAWRALAAAALPAMTLAMLFTLSRAGIASSLLAVAIFLVITRDRVGQALTLLVTGSGSALLVAMALSRSELAHGMTGPVARDQGVEMFWATIAVCVVVGLAQAAIALAGRRRPRPGWSVVSRRQSLIATGVAALLALLALLAIDAPGRLGDAWDEFREPSGESVAGTSRLTSVGGENRYQLWGAAARQFEEDPLKGTGANTFQLWWTRDGEVGEPIVDTHSLYLQVLGELGAVGLALLLGFLLVAYWGGLARVLRAPPERRSALAAALAGSTVLWLTSVVDWGWKIPVLPIATLILLAIVLSAGDPVPEHGAALPPAGRVWAAAVAVVALLAIAIPYASTALVRQSQDAAREGDVTAALADARSAQNALPGAATPRLQQALLLETLGDYEAAARAAREAAEREPTSWRVWLVVSRLEARRGRPDASLAAYREARSLNPLSPIFAEPDR